MGRFAWQRYMLRRARDMAGPPVVGRQQRLAVTVAMGVARVGHDEIGRESTSNTYPRGKKEM